MTEQATKEIVEVIDIKDEVVILKNNSLRAIIDVSSMNFELRSEEEQAGILQNFQRFLNSIDFPIQIVVQSRQYDILDYLKYVEKETLKLDNELLRVQAAEYMKFIRELSELSNIMSKKFYIVVPFYTSEKSQSGGISGGGFVTSLKGMLKSKSDAIQQRLTTEQLLEYKGQLLQRADLVLGGLVTLGLSAKILGKEDLGKIFLKLYNPGLSETSPEK